MISRIFVLEDKVEIKGKHLLVSKVLSFLRFQFFKVEEVSFFAKCDNALENVFKKGLADESLNLIICENQFLVERIGFQIIKTFGKEITLYGKDDSYFLTFPFSEIDNLNEIKETLENLSGEKFALETFKVFGKNRSANVRELEEMRITESGVFYEVNENFLDAEILLYAKFNNQNFKTICEQVFAAFKDRIYAENSFSIEESARFVSGGMRLSVAELGTSGKVISALNPRSVIEALILSEDSLTSRLNLEREILSHGCYTDEVAFEIAVNLLSDKNDLVLSVVLSDDGRCYVAIGHKNEIHVHYSKFSGSEEQRQELAKNAALFQLIKKLRQNDFHFDKSVL